jgi:hydroxyethylthiazole kinase-like sugar kinase family protein
MQISVQGIIRLLIIAGNFVTAVGCLGLLLGAAGVIATEAFAIGLSSGIRVIGSVAITGCLMSAVGYAYKEHHLDRKD